MKDDSSLQLEFWSQQWRSTPIFNLQWKPKKKIFSSQIDKPKALIPCRRKDMEGMKCIKLFSLIFYLYKDSYIYKNPST